MQSAEHVDHAQAFLRTGGRISAHAAVVDGDIQAVSLYLLIELAIETRQMENAADLKWVTEPQVPRLGALSENVLLSKHTQEELCPGIRRIQFAGSPGQRTSRAN